MFNNIGRKIQGVASFFTTFGICISILFGIISLIAGAVNGSVESGIFFAIICVCLGGLISWFSWFLIYGFGTLIDNTQTLVNIAKTLEAEYQSKNNDYEDDAVSTTKVYKVISKEQKERITDMNDTICENCGSPYLNDSNFCTNCGNPKIKR